MARRRRPLTPRQAEVLELLRCLVTPAPLRSVDGRPCWCSDYDHRVLLAAYTPVRHAPRCELQSAMPRIAVHVWRPSDWAQILEELR